MPFALQLHHHVQHAKFALVREGEDWRQEFDTLADALAAAHVLQAGTIPFIELDESGEITMECTIDTASQCHVGPGKCD